MELPPATQAAGLDLDRLSIVWLIGAYALLLGVLMLALAVKRKGFLTQARGATPVSS